MLADRVRMGSGDLKKFGEPYLYKEGMFSNMWNISTITGESVFNYNNDHIFVDIVNARRIYMTSKIPVDVTNISFININWIDMSPYSVNFTIRFLDTPTGNEQSYHIDAPTRGNLITNTIDISSLKGTQYVMFDFASYGSDRAIYEIYNVFFS